MERPTASAEPNPVGRPSKYDPRYCDEVIELMSTGLSLTAFAGSILVARSTINEWMGAHPEFSEAVKIGQTARTLRLEQDLLSGTEGPRITSRIFALKNAAPDEWRDKVETQHSGEMTHRVSRIELIGVAAE
jgi:transposase